MHHQSTMKLHLLTLKFSGDSSNIETSFQREYFRSSLSHNRAAMLVGAFFYSAFGILDMLLMPENKSTMWMIRYAIVDPLIIALFLLSFSKIFERYANPLMTLVCILAGGGIIWMIVIAPPPVGYSYYAGLLLVFIWSYTFVRIPFLWAALAGWVMVVLYEIAAIWISPTPFTILLSNNFFFVSANIMGMIACYFLEYYARRNFFLTRQIDVEREKIDRVNRELESRTLEYQNVNRTLEQEIAERRKVEEALRKSEELFMKLVDAIPDAIVHTDLNGKILYINEYPLEVSGYSWAEIEGQNVFSFVSPEDRDRLINNAFLMMESRQGPQEYQLLVKDGGKIPFEINGVVLRDKDGTPFGFVFVCRDITDRKRAEGEQYHREKLQGILEMAGTVCHEMNQPMQVIYGLSELLLMKTSENEPSYGKLSRIIEQIQRMHEITGKLMAIRHYKTEDYAGFARIIDIHESHDNKNT
ncbi:MAG: hypothetical protein CVU61_00365 [Deltaproteobacteria bacterium HGW-Deltaproteobacteria-19]|nr:MAG: hypothetical protein CVU61_00365 [Deltaproteobacteria bacterium HGW-Deltaproteobacteria-19]